MMRRLHQSRPAAAWVAVGAVLALAACTFDPKKELLEPQNPSIIGPEQVNSPTAADALRLGVLARLRSMTQSADGAWLNAGLMADEWKSSNTFFQHQDIDRRSIPTNNAEVASIYGGYQGARGPAYTAIDGLNTYLPTPLYLAQMWFTLGFAELQLGEYFCNGIPLGQTVGGQAIYSKPYTDAEVFGIAISHLDSSLTLLGSASDTASLTLQYANRIAKARAQIQLGKFAEAATLVGPVPTNWRWLFTFVTTSGDNGLWNYNNSVKRFTVSDSFDLGGIIQNALPSRRPNPRAGVGHDGQ